MLFEMHDSDDVTYIGTLKEVGVTPVVLYRERIYIYEGKLMWVKEVTPESSVVLTGVSDGLNWHESMHRVAIGMKEATPSDIVRIRNGY